MYIENLVWLTDTVKTGIEGMVQEGRAREWGVGQYGGRDRGSKLVKRERVCVMK